MYLFFVKRIQVHFSQDFFLNLRIFQSLRNLFYIQKNAWQKFLEKYIERFEKKNAVSSLLARKKNHSLSPLGPKNMQCYLRMKSELPILYNT